MTRRDAPTGLVYSWAPAKTKQDENRCGVRGSHAAVHAARRIGGTDDLKATTHPLPGRSVMLDRPEMPLLFPPLKSAMVSFTDRMPVTELSLRSLPHPCPVGAVRRHRPTFGRLAMIRSAHEFVTTTRKAGYEAGQSDSFLHWNHDLHGDVGARGRARLDQPRPGLPRHRGPRRCRAGGGRRAGGRSQPVSADAGSSRTSPGRGRRQSPLLRAGGGLGERGGGDLGRHRGGHRLPDRGAEPGRRGGADRAALRHLRAGGAPAGRDPAFRAAGAAGLGPAASRRSPMRSGRRPRRSC